MNPIINPSTFNLPAIGKIVTKQSAMVKWRNKVVVLFFLILFLNSLEIARVFPMIDRATSPGNIAVIMYVSFFFYILSQTTPT